MLKYIAPLFLFMVNISIANVVMPSIFGDHMVLQQNDDVKIWGWANPNEEVVIQPSWSNDEYKVKTSNQAYWEVKLNTPKAGGPYSIKIIGSNEIILKDILIGEVWLCSGQSNMEMSASWGINDSELEIEKANNLNIRFFNVSKASSQTPQNNLNGNWEVCSSETMKNSSALSYFFAERIQEEIVDVPIGLINSAWGGTPAEIWMPEDVIKRDSILSQAANKLTPVAWGPTEPARAFNAMIHPLIGFDIAGVLWYQGESNVGSNVYDKTLATLIQSWRNLWKKELPFYYVQISPYSYGENHFGGVEIRNAQRSVLNEISKLGMVVTSDISTTDDIHPKDKKSVGIRLANLALVNHYKKYEAIVNGPLYKNYTINKGEVTIEFDYADGLYFKDKAKYLFEISGEDGVFYPAKSTIKGQKLLVKSNQIKKPINVRFAWSNTAQSNLFNKANLPASSFKTN